jgi:hypothetical protein
MVSIDSHASEESFGIRQLSKLELRWGHHVDLAIETARIQAAVKAEIDALRMIQAGPNDLNLMNIVTRQFRHTPQLATRPGCAFEAFRIACLMTRARTLADVSISAQVDGQCC